MGAKACGRTVGFGIEIINTLPLLIHGEKLQNIYGSLTLCNPLHKNGFYGEDFFAFKARETERISADNARKST